MKTRTLCVAILCALAAPAVARAQAGTGGNGTPFVYRPDLKAGLVSAGGTKAVVRVLNVCKGDAPASRVRVSVAGGPQKNTPGTVFEEDVPPLLGTASTQPGRRSADVVITLDGSAAVKSFDNKYIRIDADPFDRVREASETNNWWEPKAQPFPEPSGYCDGPAPKAPAPAFRISGKQKAGGRTAYTLAVSNAGEYPAAWFTSGGKLPPNPCGPGAAQTRMVARVSVVKGNNGAAYAAACKPLGGWIEFQTLEFSAAGTLSDMDKVRVTLEDRLTGAKVTSSDYLVGWYEWAQALVPLGCKNFLGRHGDYLCAKDEGFAACEQLRRQGRPVKCTRAGQPR